MAKLTAEAVSALFDRCRLRQDDDRVDPVWVSGIVTEGAFHRQRIADAAGGIAALLAELPDEFRSDRGGGWSFLQACQDRHGNQWTGLHMVMERLFLLGNAAGFVTELLPREMWSVLPGGVPYYAIMLPATRAPEAGA